MADTPDPDVPSALDTAHELADLMLATHEPLTARLSPGLRALVREPAMPYARAIVASDWLAKTRRTAFDAGVRTEATRRDAAAAGDGGKAAFKAHLDEAGDGGHGPITVTIHDDGGFDEDPTSARSPGWGTRTCTGCGFETFGGSESVTEEQMDDHVRSRASTAIAAESARPPADVVTAFKWADAAVHSPVGAWDLQPGDLPPGAITSGREFVVVLELPNEDDVMARDRWLMNYAGQLARRTLGRVPETNVYVDAWSDETAGATVFPRRTWLAYITALAGACATGVDTPAAARRIAHRATVAHVKSGLVLS